MSMRFQQFPQEIEYQQKPAIQIVLMEISRKFNPHLQMVRSGAGFRPPLELKFTSNDISAIRYQQWFFRVSRTNSLKSLKNSQILKLRISDNLRTSSCLYEGPSQKPPSQDALAHGLSQTEKEELPHQPKIVEKLCYFQSFIFSNNCPKIIKNSIFLLNLH